MTDEPTQPDHERPTDPSPPPSARELSREAPTDPAPPPSVHPTADLNLAYEPITGPKNSDAPEAGLAEVSASDRVAPSGGDSGQPYDPFPDSGPLAETDDDRRRRELEAGLERDKCAVEAEAARAVREFLKVDAAGNIVTATAQEVATRPWYDWGKDTGPRLRVKGLVDPPKPEPMPDHDGWRERHASIARAKLEGDTTVLNKAYEPYLDELHSDTPRAHVSPLDWTELEPAMLAELREWGRCQGLVQSGGVGFQKFLDASAAVRLVFPDGVFEMRFDRRAVKSAWREADGQPRRAAAILVSRGHEQLKVARSSAIVVPDPQAALS